MQSVDFWSQKDVDGREHQKADIYVGLLSLVAIMR